MPEVVVAGRLERMGEQKDFRVTEELAKQNIGVRDGHALRVDDGREGDVRGVEARLENRAQPGVAVQRDVRVGGQDALVSLERALRRYVRCTASMTPLRMPMSRMPRSRWLGSSTSPPLMTKSNLSVGPIAARIVNMRRAAVKRQMGRFDLRRMMHIAHRRC